MTDKLLAGLAEFREKEYHGADSSMLQLVNEGQKPEYFIISCIDSRANPGTIFSPKPGTFFAFKAMGAIVRPYKEGTALAAALQYALTFAKVPNLVILGHTQCSAVNTMLEGIDDPDIASFLAVAKAGLEKAKERTENEHLDQNRNNLLREAEKQIVLQSVQNIKTYPSVQKALEEKRLNIKPWIFEMTGGDILEYRPDTDTFDNITQSPEIKITQRGCC